MLALGSRSNNRVVEGTKIWGIRNLGGVCGRAPGVGRVHL